MHTLILTCAGESTRFPNHRPKWSLTHPRGHMMAVAAMVGLHGGQRVIVGMRASHLAEFGAENVKREFKFAGVDVEVVDVGETSSQVETLSKLTPLVDGSFTVKDCDNYFVMTLPTGNDVAVIDLHDVQNVTPGNKSYVALEGDRVVAIAERRIIGPRFCCGAYSFADAREYEAAVAPGMKFVSAVIECMLANGVRFTATPVAQYADWGTAADWTAYRRKFKTLFVDIDGVLVESGHRSFPPRWGDAPQIAANVAYLNGLADTGMVEVILVTARPEWARDETVIQLSGLRYDRLIMGVMNCSRYIVNDAATKRGEHTCFAVNIERDSDLLEQHLKIVS